MDVLVISALEAGHEFGLADEYEVVIFWEVFEELSDLFELVQRYEMGVIDDEDEAFPLSVELSNFCYYGGF